MITQLKPNRHDDSDFIRCVNSNMCRVLVENKPKDVYIIQIANWFDYKWLNFSGIGVVKFEWGLNIPGKFDAALDEFTQDKITFPPFTPKRIISQRYFSPNPQGDYIETRTSELPHKKILQSSNTNLHRRVCQLSDSGVFIWYSSNTLINRKGSLMVYISKGKQVDSWFASFEKKQQWKLHLTKGIDRDGVQATISDILVQPA
jgi:hypothetical protein